MSIISNAGMELMETNNPFGVSSSGRRTPFDSDYSEDELDFTTSPKGNSHSRKREKKKTSREEDSRYRNSNKS